MTPNAIQEKAEAYQPEHFEDKDAPSLEAAPAAELSAAATRQLVRKMDVAILPLFWVIYLIVSLMNPVPQICTLLTCSSSRRPPSTAPTWAMPG